MATIYRADSERLTVAEAKQIIIVALRDDLPGYVSFRGDMNSAGEVDWDFDNPTQETFRETSKSLLDNKFLDLCKNLGFEPHLSIDPTATGYKLSECDDHQYMITHEQFVKLADKYSLTVEICDAPKPASAGTATVWTPARKKEARAMLSGYRSAGVRDFARRTAEAFNVSPARLNAVLGESKPKEKTKKRASFWPT